MSMRGGSPSVPVALVVISLAASLPAHGQLVGFQSATGLDDPFHTMTFDEAVLPPLTPTTPVTTQFDPIYGVTFSSGLFMTSGPESIVGIDGVWLANLSPTGGAADSIRITFRGLQEEAALAWSFQTSPSNIPSVTRFYALLNGARVTDAFFVITSESYDPQRPFIGFRNTSGEVFNGIEVVMDRPVAVWLDNVQFQVVSVVPEPSSMLLVASGLLGVGAVARRRRKIA